MKFKQKALWSGWKMTATLEFPSLGDGSCWQSAGDLFLIPNSRASLTTSARKSPILKFRVSSPCRGDRNAYCKHQTDGWMHTWWSCLQGFTAHCCVCRHMDEIWSVLAFKFHLTQTCLLWKIMRCSQSVWAVRGAVTHSSRRQFRLCWEFYRVRNSVTLHQNQFSSEG